MGIGLPSKEDIEVLKKNPFIVMFILALLAIAFLFNLYISSNNENQKEIKDLLKDQIIVYREINKVQEQIIQQNSKYEGHTVYYINSSDSNVRK